MAQFSGVATTATGRRHPPGPQVPAAWARVRAAAGPSAAALALLAAIWELGGRVLAFPFLPPLSTVLRALGELWVDRGIGASLASSLGTLAIGYALAAALGVVTGLLMGRYRLLEFVLEPYINVLLTAPSLIFVPILFIVFGLGDVTRIAVVFLYSNFGIVVNAAAAVKTVDAGLVEMARSFGASERQLLRKVVLPGGLPLLMAGLRIGMNRAVKGMINAEMYIALVGLGAQVRYYGGAFDAPRVLAIFVLIMAVAIVANSAVQAVDRRVTWWADRR